MDYSQTPLWMQDDLVRDIPREKLEFLSTLFAKGHGKSQKEMMSLLMPAIRKAKQEHLTFTPQEMQAAITAIKNTAPKQSCSRFKTFYKKATLKEITPGRRKVCQELFLSRKFSQRHGHIRS